MKRKPSGEMDPERWSEVCEVLAPALALPPADRPQFLERACGHDSELRAEVESLIEAGGLPAWLDKPAIPYTPTGVLEPGQTIGQYLVLSELGSGGMGVVYKAKDQRLDRLVALKVLSAGSPEGRDDPRFLREARAASALNHPNIVTVYEFNRINGTNFIAMEYIAGSTLQQLLADGRIPLRTGLEWARQAAGALAKAHASGIVHRDLKPGNIMVTAEGSVKVLDFGLASRSVAAARDHDSTITSLTGPGAAMGTPAYMAPEQVRGEPADQRSDIFSFGIILYEIVCGHRPFTGSDARVILYQIEHHDPPPTYRVLPSIPKPLSNLIDSCLRKDRSQRLQSMEAVTAELSSILDSPAGAAIPARPGWTRRSLAIAGVASGLGLAAALWNRSDRGPDVAAPIQGPTLRYTLEAQKALRGVPQGEPYEASADDTFQSGQRFRLRLAPAQPGFVYVINEGAGQNQAVWLLHPRHGQSAFVPQESKDTEWYVFDEHPGTERLWLVWAERPLDEMERALRATRDGELKDAGVARGIRTWIHNLPKASPQRQRNGNYTIQLHGAGSVLADLLELRHE